MAYKKQNFADGQVLKAEHLNHIESGVSEIADIADKAVRFEYQALTEIQKRQSRANIGAIGESDLESATNTALAKAKASGEFNGADGKNGVDGKDGYTPIKGTDYFTAADADKIVSDVIARLPVEEWTFTMTDGSTVTKKVVVMDV